MNDFVCAFLKALLHIRQFFFSSSSCPRSRCLRPRGVFALPTSLFHQDTPGEESAYLTNLFILSLFFFLCAREMILVFSHRFGWTYITGFLYKVTEVRGRPSYMLFFSVLFFLKLVPVL